MKKILIISLAVAMTGCGIYKPYTRPEINTDGLYGDAESADTMTLGNLRWQEVFTDPQLQGLIEEGLANNTDLQSAQWRVKEAEATLKSARLAYLPSFNFAPQGSISSFDNQAASKTYSIPVTASWQIDIFNGLTNAKRRAKALYAQSQEYEQAVKTQLIANIANLYYTLLMLDSQQEVTRETAEKWEQSVETMRALKDAGMTNEAGVAQYEGNYYAVVASLRDIETSIREAENSLCSILGIAPQQIERGKQPAAFFGAVRAAGKSVEVQVGLGDGALRRAGRFVGGQPRLAKRLQKHVGAHPFDAELALLRRRGLAALLAEHVGDIHVRHAVCRDDAV